VERIERPISSKLSIALIKLLGLSAGKGREGREEDDKWSTSN